MQNAPYEQRQFKRILLINFGGLGDEILFFPVIETLRYHYPNARISMVVEPRCGNLMAHNYFLDKIYTFDIKSRKSPGDLMELLTLLRAEAPELILSSGSSSMVAPLLFLSGADVRIGYDSGKLRFLLTGKAPLNQKQYAAQMYYDLLQPLGFPATPVVPQMTLPAIARNWAEMWLRSRGLEANDDYILIHPGVSLMSKQKQLIKSWERGRWLQLIERLLNEGETVVMAGGPDDADEIAYFKAHLSHPRLIAAYGETRDLYQLGALIERSAAMVCVDSAPLHLAVALNAHVVGIFGPTDNRKLLPPDQAERFVAVTHEVSCRPCLWDTRNTTCDSLGCLDIEVDAVYKAVRGFVTREQELVTLNC